MGNSSKYIWKTGVAWTQSLLWVNHKFTRSLSNWGFPVTHNYFLFSTLVQTPFPWKHTTLLTRESNFKKSVPQLTCLSSPASLSKSRATSVQSIPIYLRVIFTNNFLNKILSTFCKDSVQQFLTQGPCSLWLLRTSSLGDFTLCCGQGWLCWTPKL